MKFLHMITNIFLVFFSSYDEDIKL